LVFGQAETSSSIRSGHFLHHYALSDAINVSVHSVITHPTIDTFGGFLSSGSAFAAPRGPV